MKFIQLLILWCAKRALYYDQIYNMLISIKGSKHYYAIGVVYYNRAKWLERVAWLQTKFCK